MIVEVVMVRVLNAFVSFSFPRGCFLGDILVLRIFSFFFSSPLSLSSIVIVIVMASGTVGPESFDRCLTAKVIMKPLNEHTFVPLQLPAIIHGKHAPLLLPPRAAFGFSFFAHNHIHALILISPCQHHAASPQGPHYTQPTFPSHLLVQRAAHSYANMQVFILWLISP